MTNENKAKMIEALKSAIANWRAGWGNPITAAGRAVATKADFLDHFKAESLDAWPPEQDAQRAAEFIETHGDGLWARMEKLDAEDEKFENYDFDHDPAGIDD